MVFPEWLADLSATTMQDSPFPLHEILGDSLYYPASSFHGAPIQYLAGNILSFIYVDYGHSRDELMVKLENPGFLGYHPVATRSVTEEELTPQGWHPTLPDQADGNPAQYRDWIQQPFCEWAVFQRREDVAVNHGPSRFSLLYVCADGVAAFQALYGGNSIVPKAVAVIQPGHACGGNWTDFTDPQRIFARSVLGNPVGQPELLLYGGMGGRDRYRKPCWPDYQTHVCFLGNTSIGVWSNRPSVLC